MSHNLILEAEREVFTKSGRKTAQRETIDLFQTPSSVTHKILELPSFTEQLNAYCRWVDNTSKSFENCRSVYPGLWEEIYDTEVKDRGAYKDLELTSWEGRSEDGCVIEVVLKGDPKFDEIHSTKDPEFHFVFENLDVGLIGVGYRLIKTFSHTQKLRKRVQSLIDDEYELSFTWI